MRLDDSRRELAEGLRRRREEIGRAVSTRAHAIESLPHGADTEYSEGLRSAIGAAIEHTIEACEWADESVARVPAVILAQARLAARRRVPLETMLRRYLAGHAVLGDFLVEEAGHLDLPPHLLRSVLRAQAARTDQVVMAISDAYVDEASAARPLTSDRRKTEYVRRLLDGELINPSGLDYGLEGWHVGLVAKGEGAARVMRTATHAIDARRLIVATDEDAVWAWIGTRERSDPRRIDAALSSTRPDDVCVALGEPAEGPAGWRLTHRQALAALSVGIRDSQTTVHYSNVALLAVAMQDDLFTTSVNALYLEPLATGRDGGESLRETLRAFFALQQNVSSTAALLGVTRQTVTNRLRTVEQRLDRPLSSCASELQAALKLQRESPDAENAARPSAA